MRFKELLRPPAIYRNHFVGSAPFDLKGVESVPATDVKNPFPAQIIRQAQARVIFAQFLNLMRPRSYISIAQINAMPPAGIEKLITHRAGGFVQSFSKR